MNWRTITSHNEWTGKTDVRHVAEIVSSGKRGSARLEVHQVEGRYYWTANIFVAHRPDLSRLSYGMYAVTPKSLSVSKMTASRLALKIIREVDLLTTAA